METTARKGRAGKGFVEATRISRDFSILLVSLAVVSLGFGILSPIIVPYAQDNLGMDAAELGLVYSLFAIAFAAGMLPAGYLADRIGRKPLIVAGTLLFSFTTLALVFIADVWQFAVLRVLEGVGAAIVSPAAFALTVDIVPEDKRGLAMGAEGTAQLIGGLGGPGLGGILAGAFGFYSPFYVTALLALACALLVHFIREPKAHASGNNPSIFAMFQSWKRNVQRSKSLTAITTRGFVMGIVQGLWNFGLILYWYNRLDLTTAEVGVALSLGMIVMMLGTLPFGAISDRRGRKPFMILGGAIMVIGLGLNVVAENVWHVFLLVAVADFGAAMSNPSVGAMLADVMLPEERGRVMGAYQMIQGTGNIIGFTMLGYLYSAVSPEAPILLCAAALSVATLIIALFVKETRAAPLAEPQTRAVAPRPSVSVTDGGAVLSEVNDDREEPSR
ncbi:MAG: MFS transporter [Thermoplasmata archaeon]